MIGAAITVGVIGVGAAVAVALDVGVVEVMRGASPDTGSGVPASGSWAGVTSRGSADPGQGPNHSPTSTPTSDSTSRPDSSPSSGPNASSGAGRAGREAELARALAGIARSRAAAFTKASVSTLTSADELGSPAYRADLTLVKRLQSRGYRLRGVSYTLAAVRLLRDGDRTAEVAAMVTTSAHHQVATSPRTSVEVPPDGPRSLIFTLVAVRSNGVSHWRVRNIGAGS
jgi:hypothetical protein